MSWIRKLLIIIIFILFSFILFRLSAERRAIKAQYGIEGFASSSEAAAAQTELAALKAFINVSASTIDTTNAALPLAQYCIKGAYNAALTGQYINVEMIKFLFSRGCRFLDFEVFSFEGVPYIAMSTDNTFASINTANKDTLQNALTTVVNYGFVAPSQITKDPIFVHLRIKTNQSPLYDAIGKLIGDIVADKRYMDSKTSNAKAVDGTTILSDIQGKVVIVVDKTYLQPEYTTSKLGNYVNMLSNSDVMEKWSYGNLAQQQYTTPHIKDDNINTDVAKFRLVTPDLTSSWFSLSRNSVYYPMVMNYGAQVVLYPFYMTDMYLTQYEKAFADGKAGFVPMSRMIANIQAVMNAGLPPAGAPVAAPPPMGSIQSLFGTGGTFTAAAASGDVLKMGGNTVDRLTALKTTQSTFLA